MTIQFNSLPVAAPLRITSKYGKRNTGIVGASTYHKGIDLGRDFNKNETAILSVTKGTVSANYWNDIRGWVVTINHGDCTTLYQHLKAKSTLNVGTSIKAGQQIGIMGASTKTISSMGIHLHMELIVSGQQIDPEPYLKNIKAETLTEEEEMVKRYNTVTELPKALQKEAQQLVDVGALAGADGKLDVTEDMIRSMIVNKRYVDKLTKGEK